MVGKQEVWEMGTTRLEAVDGTEVGSGAAGIGAIGTSGWSEDGGSRQTMGIALVSADGAGAMAGGGAVAGGGARRSQRGMVSAEWAVGIIAAIGIAGVLIAVVTNGAVQDALLKFVLQLIHSFSGFMVKN